MRKMLLITAILCGAAFVVPVRAQVTVAPPFNNGAASPAVPSPSYQRSNRYAAPGTNPAYDTGARPGHEPGVGESYPASNNASNINGADARSQIAPRLPTPFAGESASPRTYLLDAERALAQRRTGAAQEALERAETAFLNNPMNPADPQGGPIGNPLQQTTEQARQALGRGDMTGARQLVDQVLAQMGGETRPMSGIPVSPPPIGGPPGM